MQLTRVDLNNKNLGQILRGEEGRIPADLMWRGTRIANRADRSHRETGRVRRPKRSKLYEAFPAKGPKRCRVTVRSVVPVVVSKSPLLRSIDAGKGSVKA